MNATTPQLPHSPSQSANRLRISPRLQGSASPDRPSRRKVLAETAPLIDAPAFFGPPISFVLGPWLLLVLLLIGPFALILTIIVVVAVVEGLLAAFVGLIASPYLLKRHLHAHGIAKAKPRAPLHLFPKYRVRSGRHSSPQPKGVS